jgi:cystathionine beta-lyase/cystathionine gamma-synthase
VESVIVQPAGSSHAGLPAEERAALGITDDLLRLSVGIEAREDLERDLERALGAA